VAEIARAIGAGPTERGARAADRQIAAEEFAGLISHRADRLQKRILIIRHIIAAAGAEFIERPPHRQPIRRSRARRTATADNDLAVPSRGQQRDKQTKDSRAAGR
jgi:hypothetical protein